MRADLIKDLAPELGPRHTAILVLASDYELMVNKYGITMGVHERTLKQLQTFHPKITKSTMWFLVRDEIVQPQGMGWIYKVDR